MTDQAISYQAVPAGVPVLTATGHEIGTLEHVLQIPEEDLFDGLVVATKDGLRFVDADQVQVITTSYVRSTLDDDAAADAVRARAERAAGDCNSRQASPLSLWRAIAFASRAAGGMIAGRQGIS